MTREAFERYIRKSLEESILDADEALDCYSDTPGAYKSLWTRGKWYGWQAAKADSEPVLAALRALVNEPQDKKARQDAVKLLGEIDGEGGK